MGQMSEVTVTLCEPESVTNTAEQSETGSAVSENECSDNQSGSACDSTNDIIFPVWILLSHRHTVTCKSGR